jgi:hypothetical protein
MHACCANDLKSKARLFHCEDHREQAIRWLHYAATSGSDPILSASEPDNVFSRRRAVAKRRPIHGRFRAKNHHHAPHKSPLISADSAAFGANSPGHDCRVVVSMHLGEETPPRFKGTVLVSET